MVDNPVNIDNIEMFIGRCNVLIFSTQMKFLQDIFLLQSIHEYILHNIMLYVRWNMADNTNQISLIFSRLLSYAKVSDIKMS